MKKIFILASVVACLVFAGSCQKHRLAPALGGDTKVTFTVSAGDVATRAIADGKNVDALYWEIYGDTDKDPLGEDVVIDTDGDKRFTVEITLVADQKYYMIFWAQVNGKNHYDVTDLRNVKINTYDDELANDESRAAFYAYYEFETQNGQAIDTTVTLYRPFSQLNLGATNLETSLNLVNGGKIEVDSTKMVVTHVAESFNTIDGVGEGEKSVTFQHAVTPMTAVDEKLLVNNVEYNWLGMNYLIVNGGADDVTVDIEVKTNFGTVTHNLLNVPVKNNYRTNILGDLLTTGAKFNVVVDEKFQEPDTIVPLP